MNLEKIELKLYTSISDFMFMFITLKNHNDKSFELATSSKLFAKVSLDGVCAYTAEKIDSLQILSSRLCKLEHGNIYPTFMILFIPILKTSYLRSIRYFKWRKVVHFLSWYYIDQYSGSVPNFDKSISE